MRSTYELSRDDTTFTLKNLDTGDQITLPVVDLDNLSAYWLRNEHLATAEEKGTGHIIPAKPDNINVDPTQVSELIQGIGEVLSSRPFKTLQVR